MAKEQVNSRLEVGTVDIIKRRLGRGDTVSSFVTRIVLAWQRDGCKVVDEEDEKNLNTAALIAALQDSTDVDGAIELLKKRRRKKV